MKRIRHQKKLRRFNVLQLTVMVLPLRWANIGLAALQSQPLLWFICLSDSGRVAPSASVGMVALLSTTTINDRSLPQQYYYLVEPRTITLVNVKTKLEQHDI